MLILTQGPFPPPALPGFFGTTSLSATLDGPACLSRGPGWGARLPTARASRVPTSPSACMPAPLPRRNPPGAVAHLTRRAAAFPVTQAGRLPHYPFRGLLGVHSRSGLHARQAPYGALYTEDFGEFVTSFTAPIATGWSDQLPGGCLTHRETPAFTAY